MASTTQRTLPRLRHVYFTNRTKATTPVMLRDELETVTGGSPYIHPAAVVPICPVRNYDGRDGI